MAGKALAGCVSTGPMEQALSKPRMCSTRPWPIQQPMQKEIYFGFPNYVDNWRRYGFTDDDLGARRPAQRSISSAR